MCGLDRPTYAIPRTADETEHLLINWEICNGAPVFICGKVGGLDGLIHAIEEEVYSGIVVIDYLQMIGREWQNAWYWKRNQSSPANYYLDKITHNLELTAKRTGKSIILFSKPYASFWAE